MDTPESNTSDQEQAHSQDSPKASPAARGAKRADDLGAMFAPLPQRLPRPSQLAVYILTVNAAVLIGVIYFILSIDDSRDELIEVRIGSLIAQAEIIAGALGEGAILGDEATAIDFDKANSTLRRLVVPTEARARLFTQNGRLIADSRLLNEGQVEIQDLAPIGAPEQQRSFSDLVYDWLVLFFFQEELPLYQEIAGQRGTDYAEVRAALEGNVASARRENADGELVVSVGVPVRKYKVVLGALLVSAEGGDIEAMVRENRMGTLLILTAGLFASMILSASLFLHIARPLRQLARTADAALTGTSFARVEIPAFRRRDEIGDLSVSLRRMVAALYNRIEAIESFAADVSHEIKNPLTSIRSAVETIGLVKDEKAKATLLNLIEQDVGRLDRLITDISNASRLDAELARETSEPVDLGTLLSTLTAIYKDAHKETEPTVIFNIKQRPGEKEEFFIRGLESRLGQIFSNLIANAISFAKPDDHINVTLRKRNHDGKEQIYITVDDEGPGIPPANLKTIFNRFYTERPEGTEFGSNSGLGLSISRQIVEAHEGEIWAENRYAENSDEIIGARFVVIFPCRKGREASS